MSLNYVRFDVGHHLFVCHKNTIDKYPESVLAKYVAPQFDTRKSGDDYIVIDRDGKHFGAILNFMRDVNSLDLEEWTDSNLTDLMREADFYCLNELVQLCEHHFEQRDYRQKRELESSNLRNFTLPANRRLEIVFGLPVARELLASSEKLTIIVSYQIIRKFHIDGWIEELVKICDFSRFNVYCFSDKCCITEALFDKNPKLSLNDFIVALYSPTEENFNLWVSAPSAEKFRSRRAHYKTKIFKFWMVVQSDLLQTINHQSTRSSK